jgi:hypothetical protein
MSVDKPEKSVASLPLQMDKEILKLYHQILENTNKHHPEAAALLTLAHVIRENTDFAAESRDILQEIKNQL